jgi:hypothetical protein
MGNHHKYGKIKQDDYKKQQRTHYTIIYIQESNLTKKTDKYKPLLFFVVSEDKIRFNHKVAKVDYGSLTEETLIFRAF